MPRLSRFALLLAAAFATAGLVHAQAVQWLNSSSASPLPKNVIGSGSGSNNAVCRIFQNGQYFPGEVVAGSCHAAGTGAEITADTFQVLVGPKTVTWVAGTGSVPVTGAISAGKFDSQAEYLCLASGHVGRLVAGTCTTISGGTQVESKDFSVLAVQSMAGANRGFGRAGSRDPHGLRGTNDPVPPTSQPPDKPKPPVSEPPVKPPANPTPPASTPPAKPPAGPTPPTSTPPAKPPAGPTPPASTPPAQPPASPTPPTSGAKPPKSR